MPSPLPPPLTRKDLASCGRAGCNCEATQLPMVRLGSRCHPEHGLHVAFDKRTGNLALRCRGCDVLVVLIAVAGELDASEAN